MHRRFILDWRGVSLALACAGLVLLPFTGTLAAPRGNVETDIGQPDGGGLQLKDKEENNLQQVVYARSNYSWPFASGPYYGDVKPADRRSSGMLLSPVGSFNLGSGQTLPRLNEP